MKSNRNQKHRKKNRRVLPRIPEEAYGNLKRLFEYVNDEHSFDESPTEMLEYLLGTIRKLVEKKMLNIQSGFVRTTLHDAFDPIRIESRRLEKAERLRKKAA